MHDTEKKKSVMYLLEKCYHQFTIVAKAEFRQNVSTGNQLHPLNRPMQNLLLIQCQIFDSCHSLILPILDLDCRLKQILVISVFQTQSHLNAPFSYSFSICFENSGYLQVNKFKACSKFYIIQSHSKQDKGICNMDICKFESSQWTLTQITQGSILLI